MRNGLVTGLIMLAIFAGYCVVGYDDMQHECRVSEYTGGNK